MTPHPPILTHRRFRRRPTPLWAQTLRTLWLGLLFGLFGALLLLAAVAIIGHPSAARFAPDTPEAIVARARRVLPGSPEGLLWRAVVRTQTPWGEVARLRPFVHGVEVRGSDCVLHPEGGLPPLARLERDPSSVDWVKLGNALLAVSGEEAKRSLVAPLLADPAVRMDAPPVWFVALRNDARDAPEWSLLAELTLSAEPALLAATLAGLPWRGQRPDPRGPVDLVLTVDPVSLQVIGARDGRILAAGSALVFDPNPVAVSGRLDLRDGDEVDLWRRPVRFERLDDSGYLRGARAEALTSRPPRARESSLVFDYASSDPHFEEAMAYYHGDRSMSRADSLGYPGLLKNPLRLRVHATSADNSWYSRPTREVILGDGGVDDAEDADIILHESGHALHDAIVPGFGAGDTRAISEGFSDFWAASLTDGPCVGDWDATSYSPPCLRRVDQPAVWPSWLNGLPHHDGALWSALLWDLRGILGAREAERLALAALFEQDTESTWTEAARGLGRAAERLGLSERLPEIRTAVARRGLGPLVLAATLARSEARRLDLLTPARFLDRPVSALVVQGDGRLLFPETSAGFEPRPFPQGPPTAVPCGLAGAVNGPTLEVEVIIEDGQARIRLEWREGGADLARCRVHWDLTSGELAWQYENLREPPEGHFYGGVAAGLSGSEPDGDLPSIALSQVSSRGIGGLHGFRADLPGASPGDQDPARLLGARFAVTQDPAEGGFRLRNVVPALAAHGDGPILVVQPNPLRDRAEVRLLLRRSAHAAVTIHDVTGRRVGSLGNGEWPSGVSILEWDTRDDRGHRLPAGLYWVRAEAEGRSAVLRVLVLR